MGWSWAPYLAHTTLASTLDQEFGQSTRLSRAIYGAPTPQLRRGPEDEFGEDVISWTYIDDYGAAATTRSAPGEASGRLARWADRARSAFKKVGLPVHKETSGEGIEALGAIVSGRPYILCVPREKVVILLTVTRHFVKVGWIIPRDLEKLVGCLSWCLTFSRVGLSVLNQVYHTIRDHRDSKKIRIHGALMLELEALCALAPWCGTNLEAPWLTEAFATDSSDMGFGVTVTNATATELREEARYCELRGWTVALEDSYAEIEESVWADGDDQDVFDFSESNAPAATP